MGYKDASVLWGKPVITVPAHKGVAIPRFIESCVAGVNECGRRLSRFFEPINKILISDVLGITFTCMIMQTDPPNSRLSCSESQALPT